MLWISTIIGLRQVGGWRNEDACAACKLSDSKVPQEPVVRNARRFIRFNEKQVRCARRVLFSPWNRSAGWAHQQFLRCPRNGRRNLKSSCGSIEMGSRSLRGVMHSWRTWEGEGRSRCARWIRAAGVSQARIPAFAVASDAAGVRMSGQALEPRVHALNSLSSFVRATLQAALSLRCVNCGVY